MSIGQVATRWGVSRQRVVRLIDAGEIADAFTIPSKGRFREATRIPVASVLDAEARWTINGNGDTPKRKPSTLRRKGFTPELKHFPELNGLSESPAGTHEAE